MRLGKGAKQRIKRMTVAERKAVAKAAALLADYEAITPQRYEAIIRTLRSKTHMAF